MDIQTQELKHKLRTAWKSYKALLGGAFPNDTDYTTLAYTIVNDGVMLPYNKDNICEGNDRINCLESLRVCIDGSKEGADGKEENFNKCKTFVQSSRFLNELHKQLTDATIKKHNDKANNVTILGINGDYNNAFKHDNNDFFQVDGKIGDEATNIKMIKNILAGLGVDDSITAPGTPTGGVTPPDVGLEHVQISMERVNKLYLQYLQTLISTFANENGSTVLTIEKCYEKLESTGNFGNIRKMGNIVHYLMTVYATMHVDNDNRPKFYNDLDIKTSGRPGFEGHTRPQLFGNFMSNKVVLNARDIRTRIGLNISDIDQKIGLWRLLYTPYLTGGDIMSKNNIYSSINFSQSGGDASMPSSANNYKNILTRYLTTGLISDNTLELLEMLKKHLGKDGKKFNDADYNAIKKSLVEFKKNEFEALKKILYLNAMIHDQFGVKNYIDTSKMPTYNTMGKQSGGWPGSVASILKKMTYSASKSAEDQKAQLLNLKELMEQLKTSVESNTTGLSDVTAALGSVKDGQIVDLSSIKRQIIADNYVPTNFVFIDSDDVTIANEDKTTTGDGPGDGDRDINNYEIIRMYIMGNMDRATAIVNWKNKYYVTIDKTTANINGSITNNVDGSGVNDPDVKTHIVAAIAAL